MDKFKREIWKEDNLDIEYSSLNNLQVQKILYKLSEICNIPITKIDTSCIFNEMQEVLTKEYVLLNINDKDGFKELCTTLKLDIFYQSSIYVIWNYNEIDRIKSDILQNYWNYIWYGASDEMCLLFFPEMEVLIMITDYGSIRIKDF